MMRTKNAEKQHRILVVSKDVSIMATCPRCYEQTSILVEDGRLNTEQLTTQEENEPNVEENQEPTGDTPSTN